MSIWMSSISEQVLKTYLSKVPWSRGYVLVDSFIQYAMFIQNIFFSMGLIVQIYRIIWKRWRAFIQTKYTFLVLLCFCITGSLSPLLPVFDVYFYLEGCGLFRHSQTIHSYLQLDNIFIMSLPAVEHVNGRVCNLSSHSAVLQVKHSAT